MKKRFLYPISCPEIQRRLFILAAMVLFLYAVILTLAPAARERTWDAEYNWSHWIGVLVWVVVFSYLSRQEEKLLPDADPYLLPTASLLTGLGMLSIWRLLPNFGMRQAVWVLVSGLALAIGMRFASRLPPSPPL